MISYFDQNKHGEEIDEVGKHACLKANNGIFVGREEKYWKAILSRVESVAQRTVTSNADCDTMLLQKVIGREDFGVKS